MELYKPKKTQSLRKIHVTIVNPKKHNHLEKYMDFYQHQKYNHLAKYMELSVNPKNTIT
jgi:hypothetical protein